MSVAGLPQDRDVKWTYFSHHQIYNRLAEVGVNISRYQVKQLLKSGDYKKRKLLKMKTLKEVEGRNEQFEKIASYRASFAERGLPIISIDTKKKELLGDFSRAGTAYSTGERHSKDHNFLSDGDGHIVPHGIYDVSDNTS